MSITDKTLHEAAANPDGKTYDGRKVIQWLFEATTGKPMSDAEASEIVATAKQRAEERRK